MRQTEVTGKADKVLALKKSSRGLTSGQMLECFVLLSASGGDCLDDMGRLRRDEALSQMLGYDIPAPETARPGGRQPAQRPGQPARTPLPHPATIVEQLHASLTG